MKSEKQKLHLEKVSRLRRLDIKKGDRYGKLKIVKEIKPYITPKGKERRKFLCQCDCGKKCEAILSQIRGGVIKSCGCLLAEKARERMTTHGMRSTRFYKIWCGMKERCNNKKHIGYKWYGGKGIKVSKKWDKFEGFRHDMLDCYNKHVKEYGEKQTTIDRKNLNKDYNFINCRWATWEEQGLNKYNK